MEQELAERLSQNHIRAQGVEEEIPARLTIYTDASFGKVTRQLERRQCCICGEPFEVVVGKPQRKCFSCRTVKRTCEHCGKTFWVTNRVFHSQEFIYCGECGCENPGCKRGEVTRFSESSKRRLMQTLNRVRRDASQKCCFITLTYPDGAHEHIQSPENWKSDLRDFEWRFRRRFPQGSFVWRLECESRKSGDFVGEIFPHFHLLSFNVPLTELRPWVAENWYEIAGCGNPEHYRVHRHEKAVTPVYSRRGVMSYASKGIGSTMSRELSKSLQAKGKNSGRWWGIIARNIFETFLAVPEDVEVSDADAISILRTFRKYIRAQLLNRWRTAGRRWKKPGGNSFQFQSLSVFLHGGWLRANVTRLCSTPVPCAYRYSATGRREDVPFLDYVIAGGFSG